MADIPGDSFGVPLMHPEQPPHGSTLENMLGMENGAPQKEESDIPETEVPRLWKMVINQSPEHARVAMGKDKDRKPVDPPPVIELVELHKGLGETGEVFGFHNPYFFLTCTLVMEDESEPSEDSEPLSSYLCGTTTSSIHHQKDSNSGSVGYFVFGDLGVKREGRFRLRFTLYDRDLTSNPPEIYYVDEIISNPFTVSAPKSFPGMAQSTSLTKALSAQGVRLRLRKDSRAMRTRKRNQRTAESAELSRQTKRANLHNNLALRGFVSDGSNSRSSPEFTPDSSTISGLPIVRNNTSRSNTSSSTSLEVSPVVTFMTSQENTRFSSQGLSQIGLPIHSMPGTAMGINIETQDPSMTAGTMPGLICNTAAPVLPGTQHPGAALMMHNMNPAPMTSSGSYTQEYSIQFSMEGNGPGMFEFSAGLGNIAMGDPNATAGQPLANSYAMAANPYGNLMAGMAPRSSGISDETQYADMYLKADQDMMLDDGQNNEPSNFEALQ